MKHTKKYIQRKLYEKCAEIVYEELLAPLGWLKRDY
jgi:hypothetical protein